MRHGWGKRANKSAEWRVRHNSQVQHLATSTPRGPLPAVHLALVSQDSPRDGVRRFIHNMFLHSRAPTPFDRGGDETVGNVRH